MDEHVHWRAKVAYMYMYTISQMLIYNTYIVHTTTPKRPQYDMQRSIHPFSSTKALICMEMHDWEKKQIKKSHERGGGQREDNDIWLPHWTTLNDASNACSLLLHCGCARSCTGNCKCSRAGVVQLQVVSLQW